MDIVGRLRSYRPPYGWPEEYSIIVEPTLNHVAADEIERLRDALKSISKIPNSESAYGIIQTFVDDALKEKE